MKSCDDLPFASSGNCAISSSANLMPARALKVPGQNLRLQDRLVGLYSENIAAKILRTANQGLFQNVIDMYLYS
jgi:hypothetical protein